MPDATITSTASTFGTISGTFAADQSTVTGTITAITGTVDGSVGVPGPQGQQGIQGIQGIQGVPGAPGQGVAAGGNTGEVLQKLSATSYDTGWLTLPADYITSVTAPLAVTSGNLSVDLSTYLTSATAASTYQTLAGMSSYLTTATAASTYAVIAAGQPVAGSAGQVLTKQSGTNWDSIWATPVVGDRYLTTSTTSNTLSNTNKTFTIGTGLSYTPTQNLTISYDASNHMHGEVLTYNSGTGVLTVDINHHTGSGTYAAWVVNVGGVTPDTSVAFADITGAVSGNANLQAALDLKANLASPSFTGNVSISSSTGAALFITQTGTGNILTLHDQASDTTFVTIDANGKVSTIASEATNGAGFNIAHGVAPTSPVNGDIWTTTTGLFMRQNGTTKQYVDFDTSQTINGNKTFSNANSVFGSSTATGTIGVASGATISASTKTVNVATGGVVGSTTLTTIGPVLGASTTSIGNTTAASTLNLATGATLTATTKAVNIGTNGVSGSTTNITVGPVLGASTTSIGNTTAASTLNLATGATLTATTKAVNIGTAGVAGSTTNIAIGSTTGTSTTTLQGTTNGITAAADTNSVALATTAFVVGQAGSATPLVNGTAAVGTSLRYARQDHVHGTDTSRAPLASPTFTGTVTIPAGASIDGYATTASLATYAPLASPTFTGTPTLPTGTIATTQSPGNNTTALATTAFVTAAVPAFATIPQTIAGTSTTTSLSPALAPSFLTHPECRPLAYFKQTAISGSGAVTASTVDYGAREMFLASLAVGRAGWMYGITGVNIPNMSRADWRKVDFSKKIWLSGRAMPYSTTAFGTSYPGDANTFARITLGGYSTNTTGDMTLLGIGWKKQGGLASVYTLTVHNGTTLTNVATSVSATDNSVIDWVLYSEGNGNVSFYINGTLAASTAAGPTGITASYAGMYREQVEAATTPTARQILETTGGWLYMEA